MSIKLTFKLVSEEIFEWVYEGYSDLIDNLEPDNEIIIVMDSFTKEDFEIAYLEYQKFINFNKALEDIKNKCKFWKKKELKKKSKYDLNNGVLEWLNINDSKLNKEIREILSLGSFYSFNIDYIWKKRYNLQDSILIYYLLDDILISKFEWACSFGHLEVAKWLYSLGKCDIHVDEDKFFVYACSFGRLEVAQWIYSLGGVNIHSGNEKSFTLACMYGSLEVAQWLYSLGDVDIHFNYNNVFGNVCRQGHLEVAQWLFSLGSVNIHFNNNNVFQEVCRLGKLEVAQWLFSLGGFNKSIIRNPTPEIKEWFDSLP